MFNQDCPFPLRKLRKEVQNTPVFLERINVVDGVLSRNFIVEESEVLGFISD